MVSAKDILNSQATAIVLLTRELNVSYLNQAAEALLEISSARSEHQPYASVLTEASLTHESLHQALESNQSFTKRRGCISLPGGSAFHADYTVSPVQVAVLAEARIESESACDFAPASHASLLIEIQPLDRLLRIDRDDQQVAVQETTRKLVRGMAHEVKNPLGGIRGAAQLLERELASQAQRDYTQIIISEADRLRQLVDRMLGPNSLPDFAPVNIHRALEYVIQLLDAEEPGKMTFKRDYDPSLPPIEVDLDQIIQAVLNIGRNAQQALEGIAAPTITFSTRIIRQFTIGQVRHRLVARIDISDNGPGIPQDLQHQLYYPMISGRAEGSGLGLSITQNILAQHHGLIESHSEPGCTIFSIYLPLEQPHAET